MRSPFLIALLFAAVAGSCSDEQTRSSPPDPLATEPLPGGGRLALHVRHDAGGPCIVIRGLPGGPRACGRAPSERVPEVRRAISAGPIVRRSAGGPVELYGETSARVTDVVIRYTGATHRERMVHATLARATARHALEAAGIRRPFGYFVATVPGTTRQARAEARAASGQVLAGADFSRLLADGRPTTVFLERGP
jgi:hypothetical protein